MFNIDDYIMYGTTGVCKVLDITNEKFINNEYRKYYVLSTIYSNETIIKIPVDNKKVSMRKIVSKDEVALLINNMSSMETLWIDDDRKRSQEFTAILKGGQCDKLIQLIKSIDLDKESKKSTGKKSYLADNDIMKEAERLLHEEFAMVLNISPEEVPSYIKSQLDK